MLKYLLVTIQYREDDLMKNSEFRASLMLLLAAAIWGFAFVAQRVGARYVGSFTFNGVRFALGFISLVPLMIYFNKKSEENKKQEKVKEGYFNISTIKAGIISGLAIFIASSLQQIGLVDTTAGKAAFITGFYIVLVPFAGIFLKHRIQRNIWIAAGFAITGLYLLSITSDFTISKGDLYELIGAFFWAAHILLIDKFTKTIDPLRLSFVQFVVCSILSMVSAVIFEDISMEGIRQAIIPLLYGGIASVGIAYTLQAFGQKYARPSHAAIILSMESVFASIGGLIILKELMGIRGYIGCGLMLTGMLLSQIKKNH